MSLFSYPPGFNSRETGSAEMMESAVEWESHLTVTGAAGANGRMFAMTTETLRHSDTNPISKVSKSLFIL